MQLLFVFKTSVAKTVPIQCCDQSISSIFWVLIMVWVWAMYFGKCNEFSDVLSLRFIHLCMRSTFRELLKMRLTQ